MQAVSTITGRAIPFGVKNVDTDVIIPARWLKTISRQGLGEGAFESLRSDPESIFNDPEYAGAPILIAGDNFGCGSSREHAAWALLDIGVRAVIAPSFSDIFASNAFKNGLLTVALPQDEVDRLMELAPSNKITIDLEKQTVTAPPDFRREFPIDAFRKHCLLHGLDEIGLTLEDSATISAYEESKLRPFLVPRSA